MQSTSLSTAVGRRRFVQGLIVGAVFTNIPIPAWGSASATEVPELSGTEIDLEIAELPVNFTGKKRMATAVNGTVPAPTLRLREGDTVTLRVHNRLNEMTSVHWHGLILPAEMDGVPGISFAGIPPGET